MITEELLLERIDNILQSSIPIQDFADEIQEIRLELDKTLSPELNKQITNKIKDKVQLEASFAISNLGGSGAIIAATGVGKSKIAIFKAHSSILLNPNSKILLVVPTIKLRDEGWKAEFTKWGNYTGVWDNVTSICYDSLHTFKDTEWDLIILDEVHNITENNAEFFAYNKWRDIIVLTATYPDDPIKVAILKKLGIKVAYTITLDIALKLGIVAPYKITMVTVKLDSEDKYVKAGNKAKPFLTTEAANYKYLDRLNIVSPGPIMQLKRMHFIYNLKSKTKAAQDILEKIIPKELRTLIFCGSQKQAVKVNPYRYFSKPTKPKKGKNLIKYAEDLIQYEIDIQNYQGDSSLNRFRNKEINRLSCVFALNEGENISDIDCALIIQLNAKSLHLIQRMGRILRYEVGHVGQIVIICAEDTVDYKWFRKCSANLDQERIKIVSLEDLLIGKEIIKF